MPTLPKISDTLIFLFCLGTSITWSFILLVADPRSYGFQLSYQDCERIFGIFALQWSHYFQHHLLGRRKGDIAAFANSLKNNEMTGNASHDIIVFQRV